LIRPAWNARLAAAGLVAIALAGACSTSTRRGGSSGGSATPTGVATATPISTATPVGTPPSPTPWRTPAGSYIVVAGGNQNGAVSLNEVEVAPINSNGSIGAWTAYANAFPTPVPSSGPGTSGTSGMWAVNTGGSNPHFLYGNASAPGGTTYSFVDEVETAGFTGGLLGAFFQAAPTTNSTSVWMEAVCDDSFVYRIESTTGYGTAMVGPLAAGAVTSWTAQTAIGIDLDNAAVAEASGHIYTLGGRDSGVTVISTIYRAAVTSPGVVGAWSQAGVLPGVWRRGPHQGLGVPMPGQNYLYVIGGSWGSGNTTDCYVAAVDTSGNIGAWQSVAPLPAGMDYGDAVSYRTGAGTFVAAIAGRNGSTDSSTVYYAQIGSGGTLGAWQSAPPLATGRNMAAAVVF